MNAVPPFDSVLFVSFGGPQGPGDIRPFLERVPRGRRVTPERIEEVAHHYELFGGVSPIIKFTKRQGEGLRQRLAAGPVRWQLLCPGPDRPFQNFACCKSFLVVPS